MPHNGLCKRSCELDKINIMDKIERKLEESYKSLRVQYRFTERENENFMMLMHELKNELKQLRLHDVSTRELPPWVRPLITIITMSLVTVYVIYKTFYVC